MRGHPAHTVVSTAAGVTATSACLPRIKRLAGSRATKAEIIQSPLQYSVINGIGIKIVCGFFLSDSKQSDVYDTITLGVSYVLIDSV